jgi:hypothetical protein
MARFGFVVSLSSPFASNRKNPLLVLSRGAWTVSPLTARWGKMVGLVLATLLLVVGIGFAQQEPDTSMESGTVVTDGGVASLDLAGSDVFLSVPVRSKAAGFTARGIQLTASTIVMVASSCRQPLPQPTGRVIPIPDTFTTEAATSIQHIRPNPYGVTRKLIPTETRSTPPALAPGQVSIATTSTL